MIHRWIVNLNEATGLFLLILCFAVSSVAATLTKLLREVECLHADYDRTTEAHERHHWAMQAELDEKIANAVREAQPPVG